MAHKFLDDINVDFDFILDKDDDRQEKFAQEKQEFGFASWETWNLDHTMIQLLYERVKLFKEVSISRLTYHSIEFEGEEYTTEEAIDLLLSLCEQYFADPTWDNGEVMRRIWRLWAELSPSMWW